MADRQQAKRGADEMGDQSTKRLTMSQAVIEFLKNQYVERDGIEHPLFAGCFGIFGHGCVAGIGQALQQYPDFRYYQTRNEQAMVHTAAAYAKIKNRLPAIYDSRFAIYELFYLDSIINGENPLRI